MIFRIDMAQRSNEEKRKKYRVLDTDSTYELVSLYRNSSTQVEIRTTSPPSLSRRNIHHNLDATLCW